MNLRQHILKNKISFEETLPQLNNREIELFKLAFKLYKKYEFSNPDVGIGPSNARLMTDIFNAVSFRIRPSDKETLLKNLK